MKIEDVRKILVGRLEGMDEPRGILRAKELRGLYGEIAGLEASERGEFGRKVNELKVELEGMVAKIEAERESAAVEAIDVTAPMGVNELRPGLLGAEDGSRHPLMIEIERVAEIYQKMGFEVVESRQIDDDFHMFEALNFPDGHPARDGYDSFRTKEGFIPPAHTSTMQYRVLRAGREKLEAGGQIAVVVPGRVYRNEDVDVTHEHTFYQCEGVFVSKDATLGQMVGVLQKFFETYYGQKLKVRTQPGYFPFTEPSLEFAIEKPASLGGKGDGWLEMLGCGMIHPNVLKAAGIDPEVYRGFAWGGGIERLVMLKYGIDDIRWFESGKLKFLRGF